MLVFLGIVVLVAGLLVSYTLRSRPPLLPADADHRRSPDPAACLACHGPARSDPRGPNHPLNDRCFSCHERT